MNIYSQKQRLGNEDFTVVVDYEYFYRLMCGINPELMLDIEYKSDVHGAGLEELFLYAHSKLKKDRNKVKLFWITFALIHITQSDINEELGC